jgi:hypothetical protein
MWHSSRFSEIHWQATFRLLVDKKLSFLVPSNPMSAWWHIFWFLFIQFFLEPSLRCTLKFLAAALIPWYLVQWAIYAFCECKYSYLTCIYIDFIELASMDSSGLVFFLCTWNFDNFESILIKVGCYWLLVKSTFFSTQAWLAELGTYYSAFISTLCSSSAVGWTTQS